MTDTPKPAPILRLRIHLSEGDWMGPGKADLLAGIAETGSVAGAGQRIGMAADRAGMLVRVMNAMFSAPLVALHQEQQSEAASLTETGWTVLQTYRRMQARAEAALAEDLAVIGGLGADPATKTRGG